MNERRGVLSACQYPNRSYGGTDVKKNLALITLVAGVLLAVVFLASYLHHETEEKVLSQFNERQLLIARQRRGV